jgi:GTP 3',8-cyclase
MAKLYDVYGRWINYLRISLTTCCNYRCSYCKPVAWGGSGHSVLSRRELSAVIEAAADMGIHKIRFTGGEPLLYPDLIPIITEASKTGGISDISLTTNGSRLTAQAAALADAGLTRINISLDSLDRERFRRITGGGFLQEVLRGICAARRSGLTPIKINTVVMRGVNDLELPDFVRFAREESLDVRFIEFMPLGPVRESWNKHYMPMAEIVRNCRRLAPLSKAVSDGGPATYWHINGSEGRLGFIDPFGRHFCNRCSRLRLTADGKIRPCLFSGQELDLRPFLHRQDLIREALASAVAMKKENREQTMRMEGDWLCERQMHQIGG